MSDRRHGFYDEAAETLTPQQLRDFQQSFLPSLVEFCFNGSSHYRATMESAGLKPGDVTTLEDLPKVPVTDKHETADLKFEGVMTVPYNQARRIYVSPGPQFYAYGPIPQKLNPLLKVYHAVGFRPGDIVMNCFTYHLTPAGINFDESLGEFGCAIVPAGPGNSDLLVEVLQKLEVTGYVGPPSFLKILALKARELGVDPRRAFSLECVLTSAEPLPEPLRDELQDTFGAQVRQLYGSADGLLPCFECWAADGMHVPEMMILEITDADGAPLPAGEVGHVTATVFNPYRPLLRFRNGDLGMLVEEPCACGRTAVRFRFKGRFDEAAKVRGMFVYPEQIAQVMQRTAPGLTWRAIVSHDERGLDVFTIEVAGAPDAAAVAEGIRGVVRLRAEVVSSDVIDPQEANRLIDRRTQ